MCWLENAIQEFGQSYILVKKFLMLTLDTLLVLTKIRTISSYQMKVSMGIATID